MSTRAALLPQGKVAAACEAISDESSCMSGMEGDEACAWCSSGAVGTSCQKQSDAEGLPSAVFNCTYQEGYAAYSPETPAVSNQEAVWDSLLPSRATALTRAAVPRQWTMSTTVRTVRTPTATPRRPAAPQASSPN